MMRGVRVLAVLLAVTGLAMLAASGIGTRFGVWHYRTGLSMLRYSAYVGIAALVVSVAALMLTRPRGKPLLTLLGAMVLAGITFGVPSLLSRKAKGVPPIHDITTDMSDPPSFVALLPLRAAATNSAEYAGDSIASLQRQAYPDVRPMTLEGTPQVAFERAVAASKTMGWEIVAADSVAGRIEATATTTWFGFKDDVVIRIRAADGGSRVDVRSVSRVGRSDVGANAARITAFMSELSRGQR